MIKRNIKNKCEEDVRRTIEDMDAQITALQNQLAALTAQSNQSAGVVQRQLSDIAGLIGARSQAVFGQDTTDPSLPGQIGGGTVTSIAASGGTTGFGFSGSPITSSGTITLTLTISAGAIPFGNAGGNGVSFDAANLFWDDTNNFFGLGTNAPNVPMHILANFADWTQRIVNSNASGGGLVIAAGSGTGFIQQFRDKDGNVRVSVLGNGQIGMGTATPATSALLELSSTTGALLLSRMTTAQRDALTAVNGMLIYNTTDAKFQGYEAGAWTNLI